MAVPKRRVSHARTHKRKSQYLGELTTSGATTCSHCGEVVRQYCVCPACGYYKGRKVLDVKEAKKTEE